MPLVSLPCRCATILSFRAFYCKVMHILYFTHWHKGVINCTGCAASSICVQYWHTYCTSVTVYRCMMLHRWAHNTASLTGLLQAVEIWQTHRRTSLGLHYVARTSHDEEKEQRAWCCPIGRLHLFLACLKASENAWTVYCTRYFARFGWQEKKNGPLSFFHTTSNQVKCFWP